MSLFGLVPLLTSIARQVNDKSWEAAWEGLSSIEWLGWFSYTKISWFEAGESKNLRWSMALQKRFEVEFPWFRSLQGAPREVLCRFEHLWSESLRGAKQQLFFEMSTVTIRWNTGGSVVRTDDPSVPEAAVRRPRWCSGTSPLDQLDNGWVNEFAVFNDLRCARRPQFLNFRTSGKHPWR